MYRVRLSERATRDLDPLPDRIWQRVRDALYGLRQTPRRPGSVKIHGQPDVYRLRIGDYRVLYHIDDAAQTVTVLRVLHRRDAYRRL